MKSTTNNLIFIGCFVSILFLGSFLSVMSTPTQTKVYSKNNTIKTQENIESSQFADRKIRVAVYSESNLTTPTYAHPMSTLYFSFSGLWDVLEKGDYDLTTLTAYDICNHKLKTADYDIFIIPDNFPRENTTNLIKEFWLGGGGILSFDNGISYICYSGMIVPESLGSNGEGKYWTEVISVNQKITARHSASKVYYPGFPYQESNVDHATFNWTALQKTSISSELIKIATHTLTNPINVTALVRDPLNEGGRVVHLACRCNTIDSSMEELIFNCIDWLCPHPKAHILFDLSHKPYYGLDSWDSIYVQSTSSYYSLLRNNLVNRSYTLDKLYPSISGNLTLTNLASYDLLWIDYPEINFTGNEVSSVNTWIHNGGGLFVIGDIGSAAESKNINFLLSQLNLILNTSKSGSGIETFTKFENPTVESCTQIGTVNTGLINYTGNAFPIWGKGPNYVVVAGQEYGDGRVILIADGAVLRDSSLHYYSHRQYGINAVNWLTSGKVEVLIYVDNDPDEDPNDNPYKGPVATALNDLGLNFYLTFNSSYFNLSLCEESWTLVVIDNNHQYINSYFNAILDYVKNGGKLIVYSWYIAWTASSPLWQYLGFNPSGTVLVNTPQTIHLWNTDHSVFKAPAFYDKPNINTTLNPYYAQFHHNTVYNNATAIAGLASTPSTTNGAIILSNNKCFISNTFPLTEYYDDTDDSTYPDGLEIWENEIALLMPSNVVPIGPSGGDDDDDGGEDSERLDLMWLIILIGVILGIIAIVAIVIILKKKR